MYAQRNVEARSCNRCCCGKAISITYSKSVFVALGIQHAMRMCRIVICGLSSFKIFFPYYLINGTIFGNKSLNVIWMSDFLKDFCLKHFSLYEELR